MGESTSVEVLALVVGLVPEHQGPVQRLRAVGVRIGDAGLWGVGVRDIGEGKAFAEMQLIRERKGRDRRHFNRGPGRPFLGPVQGDRAH